MLSGYTLMASNGKYYSEWNSGAANAGRFTIVTNAIGTNTTFDVAIETKNRGDADPTTALATFTQITATGTSEKRASGMKELYRLRYEVGGSGSFRFVEFDVPVVSWEPN